MKPHREYFLAIGIGIGIAAGFILGSVIALWVGEEGFESVRRAFDRAVGREERPKFELLLQ
jgi:hypothetical protein